MVSRLEALLDAIAMYNGSTNPDSQMYQNRNPLGLIKYTDTGEATKEMRKFASAHGGLLSGIYDLSIKCSGKSRAKLSGDKFNLRGLVRAYSMPDASANFVAKFLRKALSEPTISPDTRLDYFIQGIPHERTEVVKHG